MQQIKYLAQLFLLSFSMSFLVTGQIFANDLDEVEKFIAEIEQALKTKDAEKMFELATFQEFEYKKPALDRSELKKRFIPYINNVFKQDELFCDWQAKSRWHKSSLWQQNKIANLGITAHRHHLNDGSICDEYKSDLRVEEKCHVPDGQIIAGGVRHYHQMIFTKSNCSWNNDSDNKWYLLFFYNDKDFWIFL